MIEKGYEQALRKTQGKKHICMDCILKKSTFSS